MRTWIQDGTRRGETLATAHGVCPPMAAPRSSGWGTGLVGRRTASTTNWKSLFFRGCLLQSKGFKKLLHCIAVLRVLCPKIKNLAFPILKDCLPLGQVKIRFPSKRYCEAEQTNNLVPFR